MAISCYLTMLMGLQNDPWVVLALLLGAGWMLRWWWQDTRATPTPTVAEPPPQSPHRALPGATLPPPKALWIAAAGGIGVTLLSVAGEQAMALTDVQTTIAWWYLGAMLAAGIVEEILFRGYLIRLSHGPLQMWLGMIGASLLFALLHTQYYMSFPENGGWWPEAIRVDAYAVWTLTMLTLNSLWFYGVRIMPANPTRSLLPCFVAHLAVNLSVFAVKACEGFVKWT